MEDEAAIQFIAYEDFVCVNLVSYTQPADGMGSNAEEHVAFVARVSNPANQANTKTSRGLVKYLAKNAHWSPFEMYHVTLEIITTRDISRQILRHWSFRFQEFSQRYATVDSHKLILRDCRMQDRVNRQNSLACDDDTLAAWWDEIQKSIGRNAMQAYNAAIANGVAKEQARALLPEGMTPTRLYMSGSLRSWYHYVGLRHANGTQREHSIIADKCAAVLETLFPQITAAMGKNETSI